MHNESEQTGNLTAHYSRNWSDKGSYPRQLDIVEICIMLPATILTILSSLIVMIVVLRCRKLHTVPGYLMLSLAVADICFVITSLLPSLIAHLLNYWPFGVAVCYVQAFASTYLSSVESGIIMLCSIDRCIAIATPLKYSQHRSNIRRLFLLLFLLVLIYNLPWILVIPFLIDHSPVFKHRLSMCVFKLPDAFALSFVIAHYSLQYGLPGTVILSCYGYISLKAVSNKRLRATHSSTIHRHSGEVVPARRKTHSPPGSAALETSDTHGVGPSSGDSGGAARDGAKYVSLKNSRGTEFQRSKSTLNTGNNFGGGVTATLKHLKICKMLFIITILFFVSFLPLSIYQIVCHKWHGSFNIIAYRIFNMLQYINSVTDGFIFYFMSNTFQDSVKMTFKEMVTGKGSYRRHQYRSTYQSTVLRQSTRTKSSKPSKLSGNSIHKADGRAPNVLSNVSKPPSYKIKRSEQTALVKTLSNQSSASVTFHPTATCNHSPIHDQPANLQQGCHGNSRPIRITVNEDYDKLIENCCSTVSKQVLKTQAIEMTPNHANEITINNCTSEKTLSNCNAADDKTDSNCNAMNLDDETVSNCTEKYHKNDCNCNTAIEKSDSISNAAYEETNTCNHTCVSSSATCCNETGRDTYIPLNCNTKSVLFGAAVQTM